MRKIIRGITLSMICVVLLVAVSAFGQENQVSIAELKSLARKMNSTRLTKKQMAVLSGRLATLTPEEVFQLRQLWREELMHEGDISLQEAEGFSLLEDFDLTFYREIEELFGEGKTIYNISPEELDLAEESLQNSGKEEEFS